MEIKLNGKIIDTYIITTNSHETMDSCDILKVGEEFFFIVETGRVGRNSDYGRIYIAPMQGQAVAGWSGEQWCEDFAGQTVEHIRITE